ncbi:head completion protein [uncultured Caudovirales phage]|uniref:Head completion nuclease n=1 Tax=uncultured Caudovirales phage TaxID=2100421 RepID=A0A6J5T0W0_9CAUD|nr:head completion protein [uncultured Caudovirales phage]
MSKYAQGKYQIKHIEKYIGKKTPTYRSSWEFSFCTFCDNNPAVIQWASEPFMIPYRNPLTGKNTIYVPDFLMIYIDKSQKKHAEVIEVKPMKETNFESAKSVRDKAAVALNMAKWAAARAFCANSGMVFRIVTEHDIYTGTRR